MPTVPKTVWGCGQRQHRYEFKMTQRPTTAGAPELKLRGSYVKRAARARPRRRNRFACLHQLCHRKLLEPARFRDEAGGSDQGRICPKMNYLLSNMILAQHHRFLGLMNIVRKIEVI